MTIRRTARSCIAGLVLAATVLALTEAGLRLTGIGDPATGADPFTGFTGQAELFVPVTDDDGRAWLETAPARRQAFNRQRFAARKSPGTFRIFCLGGSTTYGRPYEHSTSFCGWLAALLPRIAPDTDWEVINAGGVSYASYRLAMLMEELAGHSPDLFILYSGHNEYLERRTYRWIADLPRPLARLAGAAARTHLFGALNGLVERARSGAALSGQPDSGLQPDVDALLDDSAGFDLYERALLQRERTVRHYRHNLVRILALARRSGARMLWITPASNLKDMSPFKSVPGQQLSAPMRDELARLMTRIRGPGTDPASLLEFAERAAALDPAYAEAHFALGRVRLALARFENARASFQRAVDEDVVPLRMTGALRTALEDVAAAHRVPLIDYPGLLGERLRRDGLAHGIPGDELFLDHVHPTIEANRHLAVAIVEWMQAHALVAAGGPSLDDALRAASEQVESSLDGAAQARALANLARVMAWARKYDESERHAARAYRLGSSDAFVLTTVARVAVRDGDPAAAVALLRRAVLTADARTLAQALVVVDEVGRRFLDPRDELDLVAELASTLPDSAPVLQLHGVKLAEQGRFTQALQRFQAALALDPDLPQADYNAAMSLSELGRFEEAVPHFEHAVRARPDDPLAHNNLGVALAQAGRLDEAAEALRRALALDPSLANARRNLASIEAHLERR